ncbi:hypothetical protein [Tenacibaculum caenipelagi]|uniref:Uncharacterized protein n=1 Tax=Tenacibaculum caenipelagi TaxID=1325435 RepID=A0A4R6TFW0_9FLAO|nr:hypothetical protein [Tenacibaculum caenipelagi]TDQ27670.1 hypothetical protein DFQ07_1521 [Tenacibaculum caenipelagi]
MLTTIQELIHQRTNALEYDNFELLNKKIIGRVDAGGKVEIQWKDKENTDTGYVFTLPNMDLDENDFFIHIPYPDNSGGIGDAPEVHIHALELASFDLVYAIKCSPKQ